MLPCLLQMRMLVSYLDIPYLFAVGLIVKCAICATVDPLVVPLADNSKLLKFAWFILIMFMHHRSTTRGTSSGI